MSSNSNHPFQSDITYIDFTYTASVAVNTDYSDQPNMRARGKLSFFSFIFTADANAANRIINIGIEKAGTFIPIGASNHAVTANESFQYFCYPRIPLEITASDVTRYIPLPDLFCIYQEDYIQTSITNMQANDQLTVIHQWIEYQPTARES